MFPIRQIDNRILFRHKSAGTYLLSVPRTEALPLPIKVEQTTSEPTPI